MKGTPSDHFDMTAEAVSKHRNDTKFEVFFFITLGSIILRRLDLPCQVATVCGSAGQRMREYTPLQWY